MRIKDMDNKMLLERFAELNAKYSEPFPKTILEKMLRMEVELLRRLGEKVEKRA